MQSQNQEILAVVVLGILLALLLIGFIVAIVFLYQKRQQQHQIEILSMQEEYDQQILRVQFEMQEATLAEISNKLHDSIKNNINGIVNDIAAIQIKWKKNIINSDQVFQELERYEKDLVQVRDEVRLTSHSLSNDKLSKVGLIDTITFESNRVQRNNKNVTVKISVFEDKLYNLTQEQSIFIYRIFQEMIGNALAHSKASVLEIYTNIEANNNFVLLVTDNGIGFNVAEKTKSKLSGIGLSGMQKRALQIGAKFNIDSHLNKGTSMKLELPLPLQLNTNEVINDKPKAQYSFD